MESDKIVHFCPRCKKHVELVRVATIKIHSTFDRMECPDCKKVFFKLLFTPEEEDKGNDKSRSMW